MNKETHAYFAALRADLAQQQHLEHQRQQITNQVLYLKIIIGLSIITAVVVGLGVRGCDTLKPAEAAEIKTGTASWYNVASTIREGTCTNAKTRQCLQANGQPLKDEALTVASWDYPLNTRVRVCNSGGSCVLAKVADRGPARHLYRRGRIADLSKAAFAALAPLSQGIIDVSLTEVKP